MVMLIKSFFLLFWWQWFREVSHMVLVPFVRPPHTHTYISLYIISLYIYIHECVYIFLPIIFYFTIQHILVVAAWLFNNILGSSTLVASALCRWTILLYIILRIISSYSTIFIWDQNIWEPYSRNENLLLRSKITNKETHLTVASLLKSVCQSCAYIAYILFVVLFSDPCFAAIFNKK